MKTLANYPDASTPMALPPGTPWVWGRGGWGGFSYQSCVFWAAPGADTRKAGQPEHWPPMIETCHMRGSTVKPKTAAGGLPVADERAKGLVTHLGLTLADAARRLGVSTSALSKAVQRGKGFHLTRQAAGASVPVAVGFPRGAVLGSIHPPPTLSIGLPVPAARSCAGFPTSCRVNTCSW